VIGATDDDRRPGPQARRRGGRHAELADDLAGPRDVEHLRPGHRRRRLNRVRAARRRNRRVHSRSPSCTRRAAPRRGREPSSRRNLQKATFPTPRVRVARSQSAVGQRTAGSGPNRFARGGQSLRVVVLTSSISTVARASFCRIARRSGLTVDVDSEDRRDHARHGDGRNSALDAPAISRSRGTRAHTALHHSWWSASAHPW